MVLFLLPFLVFHNTVIGDFLASLDEPLHSLVGYLDTAISVIVIFLLYRLYARVIERREAFELGIRRSAVELGAGFLISLGLVGIMVSLMAVLGYYKVEQIGSIKLVADAFFYFGMGAFIQVLVFRIILFRLFEEMLGSWVALVMIATIFGLVHMNNENATAWSTLLVILSDILLVAAFMFTRRIWLVWGIHWGWNFFQDGIFGMPNSGITVLPSWFHPVILGPEWITGGSFGIEASVITVLLSVVVGAYFLMKAVTNHQIVPSSWRRAVDHS